MISMIRSIALVLSALSLLTPLSAADGSTPAERRIAFTRKAIERQPGQSRPYNRLAMALAQRARETADPDYYRQALAAVKTSLELAPDNYGARKARVWCLLGQHELTQALEEAKLLNRLAPDDIQVYGFLADAYTQLGKYSEAEKSVQWMLDLRPGNVPGLTRGAYLRELYGLTDGAVEFLQKAYQRIRPTEVEHRAWILSHLARLRLGRGQLELAETVVDEALLLFPDYHYALATLAEVRMGQRRFAEAAELFERRYKTAPHPENLLDVALALEKAGRTDEAKAAYRKFEKLGRAEMEGADNCNRELVFYYTDQAGKPDEALGIARREIERRRDVFTRDAYAWALYAGGDYQQAHQEIELALAPGIQDAKLFYHAAEIAVKLNDGQAAERYWNLSLSTNAHSPVASDVRASLARWRSR